MKARIAIGVALVMETLSAQAQVSASVSDTRLSEGESFQYVIKVENGDIQQLQLTDLVDFRRLSGPSTSRNMQIINGQVRSSSSYRWELMPRKSGNLTIPPQRVVVAGKAYQTQAIPIEVREGAALQADGSRGALYLDVVIEPEGVYVGQQVTVTWTLYTEKSINGWEVLEQPRLKGFWTEDLFAPNKLQLREKIIGGKRYYTAVVRRAAIFPTRSGLLEIDPFALRIAVQTQNRRRDPFFNDLTLFGRRSVEQKTVSSPATAITIKPLPTARRPDNFTGVVGDFTLTGGLSTLTVDQHEALTLQLIISGNGNIKTLELPTIEFPDALEVFEPQSTIEPSLGNIIGGSRTVEYVIIPRQSGILTIPAITLPYFNPSTGRYETGSVGPFGLNVAPGATQAQSPSGFSREEVALLGVDIRFVKMESPRWFKRDQGWYSGKILLLNTITLFLFALPWIAGKVEIYNSLFSPKMRARRALAQAVKILSDAQVSVEASGESDSAAGAEVYGKFSRAVTTFLNAKLGRAVQEYSLQEIETILRAHKIGTGERVELAQLLDQAAAARFAPSAPGGAELSRDSMAALLSHVDEQWSA